MMVNRKFNGVDIGDSAVAFFDKLAKFESADNYAMDRKNFNDPYIGRYQLGTDVLEDIGWAPKGSKWSNIKFIGEAATKWKLTGRESFLNNPAAQDEVMMKSMVERWKVVGKYRDKICSKISVPSDAQYLFFGKSSLKRSKKGQTVYLSVEGEVKKRLSSKKSQGYKAEDLKGKSFILTSSGLLAASHLCGQGAMSNAIGNNFKGKYGIPVDGNAVPSLFYHDNLSGYDLSVIIGYKDNCEIDGRVVEKNDGQIDNKNINTQAKTEESEANKEKNIKEEKEGVFVFNGQKFEEVWDSEEYRKDRYENSKAPQLAFVNPEENVLKRLQLKFMDTAIYNKDYVKYIETKTGKKVLEENKEDINIILKMYDESTKDNKGIGNIIRQHGFDILRGREETSEVLRIQDIIYYIYSYPIPGKSKIESLEQVLSQYSARYVKYPDRKPLNKSVERKSYSNEIEKIIKNFSETVNKEDKIEKNILPEKYDKYMEGVKDIDEIVIKVCKKPSSEFSKMKCENLIRELGEDPKEYEKTYLIDENGVRQYPLSRRIIDNIIIEFLCVQIGFKEENETKYFDNHKYKDSNIVRNYLLWYIERQKGIDLPSKGETGLYDRLEKLGKEIRVTTLLKDWISSKSAIKVRNIRKISNLIDEVYDKYRDKNDFEKDRAIVYGLFKDSKELRDYTANIDSMDIYSFYKSFYELKNIINPNAELFVNDNCILKCTLGEDISRLVINGESVTLGGGRQANINDKQITPFKRCRAIGVCNPQLMGMWEKNTDVEVRNQPALLDISTISCKFGGIISIDDAGQKEMGTAVSSLKISGETERDADCVYKLLIDVCRDINDNFMQTDLKKELQKFSRWKKYIEKTEMEAKKYIANEIKAQMGLSAGKESEKKEYENFIKKNKMKMENAKKATSLEKEKMLKDKVFNTFKEANKRVNQTSNPAIDTKGIVKKYGVSLCDYEKKNFYSAKSLPVIAYGYLMKAADLKPDPEVYTGMKMIFDMDNRKADMAILDLSRFHISGNLQKVEKAKEKEVKNEDIRLWMSMGEVLYTSLKNPPTEWDILKKIRENGKSLTMCPFDIMEWNKNHSEDSSLVMNNLSPSSIQDMQSVDEKSDEPVLLASASKTSAPSKASSCSGNSCPHVGVKGYYALSVIRTEETSMSTLSRFSILDPNGKKVGGYDGYIIEREGPDTIESGKKKRIVEGEHKLRFHYRYKHKHNYWALGIYNHTKNEKGKYHKVKKHKVLIHENRWILIHPGTGRNSSVGCLIISKHYFKEGILHKCDFEESRKFLGHVLSYIVKIEGVEKKDHLELKKFKLKISNKFKK